MLETDAEDSTDGQFYGHGKCSSQEQKSKHWCKVCITQVFLKGIEGWIHLISAIANSIYDERLFHFSSHNSKAYE